MRFVRSVSRISLVEYGVPVDPERFVQETTNLDKDTAIRLLTKAGLRVASSLGFDYNPIRADTRGVRAVDFAGLVRLSPSLELEVSPKFLGLDETDATWREDFYFLSTLSRHGRILATDRISASGKSLRDLATLIARSMSDMYESRRRRPLRSYRRVVEINFSLEGEIDPEGLRAPSPDGFEHEFFKFDRQNPWNADIVAAAKGLLPEVSNPSVAGSLMRVIRDLSPQRAPQLRFKPVPARHRSWGPLHELSRDLLRGLGLGYERGQLRAPGFLVATWRAWEHLIILGARLAFGGSTVTSHAGFELGSKVKLRSGTKNLLSVYPDCHVAASGTRPQLLIDAKYKGHLEKGQLRIAEADVYEALAFSRASNCRIVVLAYPDRPVGAPLPVGTCRPFETVKIGDLTIIGVQVEIRRISQSGALGQFSANFKNGIERAALFAE